MIKSLLLIALMGFMFGWGGEPWFGKARRGALLIIPMTLIGIGVLSPMRLILQALLLPVLYMITMPSKLAQGNIWGDKPKKQPVVGWALIALNGAIFGLTSLFLVQNALGLWVILPPAILAWCGIMYLSNGTKIVENFAKKLPDWYLYEIKNEEGQMQKCCRLRDAWFLCEVAYGLVLGAVAILAR